ncbi:MAG: type II secretion system protein GspM [Dissulfurispiraceae bacterium]|jgi:hypothetical protein
MRKSKLMVFSIPLMIILFVLVAYRYGYLGVKAQVASVKETEAAKLKILAKYMALLAEKPALEKELSALKEKRKSENSQFSEGQTPSIAAAGLQDIVKGIVTGRGGTITSERIGKSETLGKLIVLNVSMDTTIPDVRALADILYAIETRTPSLVVKEVDGKVKNFREPKELLVKLDISAITAGK